MNNEAIPATGKSPSNPSDDSNDRNTAVITFRPPALQDGKHIWQLVKDIGVLDLNSVYCYLVLCDHFRDTCAVAEMKGEIIGFVTAYVLPEDKSNLFVWQVGIAAAARGRGVAKKLILELLSRKSCRDLTHISATISPSNKASLALFNSLAGHLQTDFNKQEYYDRSLFPENGHEQEDLISVGPFNK